jgi:deoxyadenosine/deoxycytidine kinase
MVVAIEGLPGAGKTTAAGLVAARLGVPALRETTGDHPFLQQVYQDEKRDDLTVELAFLLVHGNAYRLLDRSKMTICDFSPAKDLLFAEDMLDGEDRRLFESLYGHLYRGVSLPEIVVYLNVDPAICLDRVRHRMQLEPGRAFEAGMTLGRLQRMEQRYRAGVSRLGQVGITLDIDHDLGPADVAERIVDHLGKLQSYSEE